MCKAQCPCDPRGRNAISRWSNDQIARLTNEQEYFYNGWHTNFYDCYSELVKNNIIEPENRISSKVLMFI